MPRTKRTTITSDNPAIDGPRAPADRLYRAAAECVRQRQRYAALVEAGAQEGEQKAILQVACLCDEVLLDSIEHYEGSPATGAVKDEEWYRKAIQMWQASRDYERRHRAMDQSIRKMANHSSEEIKQMALEYDLEASALLALQHAIAAYRKTTPEAHIEATASRLS